MVADFDLAMSDETLWQGYEEWLNEQAALATFMQMHEHGFLGESLQEKFLTLPET